METIVPPLPPPLWKGSVRAGVRAGRPRKLLPVSPLLRKAAEERAVPILPGAQRDVSAAISPSSALNKPRHWEKLVLNRTGHGAAGRSAPRRQEPETATPEGRSSPLMQGKKKNPTHAGRCETDGKASSECGKGAGCAPGFHSRCGNPSLKERSAMSHGGCGFPLQSPPAGFPKAPFVRMRSCFYC